MCQDGIDLYEDFMIHTIFGIFLTGSSSKLLSYEIFSTLAGRNLTYTMYHLSFKEFLRARSVPLNTQFLYSNSGIIKKELVEYLEYGRFPEIAVLESKDIVNEIDNIIN